MAEFPFQLVIKPASSKEQAESVLCTSLLRAIAGRREVYDAEWNGRPVIAKVFSHKIGAKRHLKREWRGLSLLQVRGLNSPEPLFYGQTDDGRWAVVVTKIAESATVLDILCRTEEKSERLDLLILVCKELAKQHDRGVIQKDLHLGNFLLSGNNVFVLDPGSMRLLSRPVTKKTCISQLALLLHSFPGSEEEIVARLSEAYFEMRDWRFGQVDRQLFAKRLRAQKKRGMKRGLKKCLRTSKRYVRIKSGKYLAVFDRSLCRGCEPVDFVEQVDALMDTGQILKNGNTCYVSRLRWNGEDMVVKRYNHKGFVHSVRHTIKRSRARRGWLHAHRLGMLQIATPKPLAYVEQRKAGLVWKSYLITKYVEGQTLHDFLHDEKTSQEERATVTQKIIDLVDSLSQCRISHGDLKHSNILLTDEGPVFTDLDGMKVYKRVRACEVRKTKDLERFRERR